MPRAWTAAVIVAEVAAVGVGLAAAPRWADFLAGDCPYYAAAAESLLRDGDLDLRNQLGGDLRDHHGFFAASPDGRVVPKHSVLMPLLSLPFLAAGGRAGLLLFNVVQVFVLVRGIAALAGNTTAARVVALAGYLTTPFVVYTFNYSPDVLGTALVVWANVAAARGRWVGCGLLAGLAVWAKLYLAVVLLPLALLMLPAGWRATLRAGLAAAVALAPCLALNRHLYGSPFATGYDRDARVADDGTFVLVGHYGRFNQPLAAGLRNVLLDVPHGVLVTAPLWGLWPLALMPRFRRTFWHPRLVPALALAILANLLLIARYDEWDASHYGNRYLFPAVALGLALQEPLWRAALARLGRRYNDRPVPEPAA